MAKHSGRKIIETRIVDGFAIVRFKNPAKRNVLSLRALDQIEEILNEYETLDLKAIVFTGIGDTFAAGADLGQVAGLTSAEAFRFGARGQEVFGQIRSSQNLTIAAINGYCMGGALDLALSCSVRIAVSTAKFAHPGVKLGIITGWGGTQMLPRQIGRKRALELFLTGDAINSEKALEIGLIHEIAEDPVSRAFKYVER